MIIQITNKFLHNFVIVCLSIKYIYFNPAGQHNIGQKLNYWTESFREVNIVPFLTLDGYHFSSFKRNSVTHKYLGYSMKVQQWEIVKVFLYIK